MIANVAAVTYLVVLEEPLMYGLSVGALLSAKDSPYGSVGCERGNGSWSLEGREAFWFM